MEKGVQWYPVLEEYERLECIDGLVYLGLRYYMNKDTEQTFVSLRTLSKKLEIGINYVRDSIKRLKINNFITLTKRGNRTIYTLHKLDKFEMFSREFVDLDMPPKLKAYLIGLHSMMFKDYNQCIGKISYSPKEIAEKLHLSESTVRRYNNKLVARNILTIVKNKSKDIETGLNTNTFIIDAKTIGQAALWLLLDTSNSVETLEVRANEQAKEIAELKARIEKLEKDKDKLTKREEKFKNKYKKIMENKDRTLKEPITFTL